MEVGGRRLASEARKTARGAWLPRLSGHLRLIVGLAAMMCMGGFASLIVPGLAAADPVPLWSDPITTSAWAAYGAGGREAVYVNEFQAGILDTERVIRPDGAVEYQADTGNTTIAPPALATDGSGYVLRGGGVAGVIDAIDTAGKVRWSYVVPATDTVRAVVAGNDGAAYVAMSNSIGGEVVRLSPADGSVTFDTSLPYGVPLYGYTANGFLFAGPSGVAAISGTHVLFLSQQGQVTADVQAFPSGSASVFTSNNAGDVFVGTAPVVGSEVNLTNGLSVAKVDPGGQVEWTIQTPPSSEVEGPIELAALPDGGVAYEVADQSVGVLNADGTTRWNTNNPLGYGAMLADSSDHIDFERIDSNQSCSDAVANCDGFAVDQVEASNGQVQRSVSLVPSEDPTRFWFCGGFSLGTGLFYVVDRLSPPDGETCGGGTTLPQLQAFALPGTAGPYPSPPATTIPTTTGGSGGTGSGTAGGGSGSSGSGATHKLPIVLVPGLNESTNEVRPHGRCKGFAGSFAPLCEALSDAGFPVYVVSASVGGKGTLLDNRGDLKTNAKALTSFLTTTVRQPALLVGHSMGGLIARIAISRYDAPAAGLFTVGTPHDGSFLADIAVGIDVECATANPTMCALLGALAKSFPAFNSPAALAMTALARGVERLPAPGVPIWTVAGTAIESSALPSYLFPNDLAVGETSAHGLTANLGAQEGQFNLPLYHINPFSLGFAGITLGAQLSVDENEFDSPAIASLVAVAATELMDGLRVPPVAHTSTVSNHLAVMASAHHLAKAPTYDIKLYATKTISTTQSLASGGLAVAGRNFRASCGKEALATIMLPGGLFAFDAAEATCAHPTVTPPRDDFLAVTSDPGAAYVAVTTQGERVTFILRAAMSVRAATLRLGKHVIRLHRATLHRWHLTTTMVANDVTAVLTAHCGGRTYAASVPL